MLGRLASQRMVGTQEHLNALLGSPQAAVTPPLVGSSLVSPFAAYMFEGGQDSQSTNKALQQQQQQQLPGLRAATSTSSATAPDPGCLPDRNIISLPSTLLSNKEGSGMGSGVTATSSAVAQVSGRVMDLDIHPDVQFELDWER